MNLYTRIPLMKNKPQQFYHKLPIKKAEKTYWRNLMGCASGLAIATSIKSNRGDAPALLVITPDALTASRLAREVQFFIGSKRDETQVLMFPGLETLPYDYFSPHEDIISQRILTLYQLPQLKSGVIFVDAQTLMQRLPPRNYVEANSFVLKVGEQMDFAVLQQKLEKYGYCCVKKVMEHGEFAVRGSIIDIFPMGSTQPLRLDLLDMEIDSIRLFEVDTQRSFKTINEIKLLPAKEFPLDIDGSQNFCASWESYFGGDPLKCPMYQSVKSQATHPGIEYYLPLFFSATTSLFAYLPANCKVITTNDVEQNLYDFWEEIKKRYEQLSHDQTHPLLSPSDIFIPPEKVLEIKNSFPEIFIDNQSKEKDCINNVSLCFDVQTFDIDIDNNNLKDTAKLQTILNNNSKARVLFTAESLGKREAILDILHKINIIPTVVDSWQDFIHSTSKIAITIAPIKQPLHIIWKENNAEILLLTENQFFGDNVGQPMPSVLSTTEASLTSLPKIDVIRDLTELQIDAPVVHIDYGVGRYLGLQKLKTNDYETEFLALEYANQAKLYVPVTSFGLISRYMGVDAEHAPLNHLGSKQWEKIKNEAVKKIQDTAAELLEIYANRTQAQGFIFNLPMEDYERFSSAFPFIATLDQERAIAAVISDMTSGRSMDRLICGDVGFGKTEVAMRAAFLAVHSGKQVAILTPTTLLAQQHFTNFQDRFASWPVKIALFSRFRGNKEQKEIIEDLACGKIDIVIGTHKLLQKNVCFKQLGLLIIDEEHRFGVKQKEHIKKIATNIDILALTATPIPRTLNMAFAGIRDFSIIATPPAKRLAIKTFVHEYNPYLIKEAILRETLRGGQVYFVHNDITTIEKTARELQRLIPNIRLAIAHGQMRKQQLAQIMHDFYHHHVNVLVCTTIIESGLDIAAANTIIIDRADRFGLAQLHQLRGRVGRSHHQAYAYLIVPPDSMLTSDAKKRLEAIIAMKDLGTGFALATNDLEIRGAGELLGDKQSGVIQGIGFTLYMEMLERAIKTLKKSKDNNNIKHEETEKIKTEMDLQIAAIIPDSYVGDINQRLVLYKRIAEAKNQNELDELQIEMIDRFGLLPLYAKNLFKISALKIKAQQLGIKKFSFGASKGIIQVASTVTIDPQMLIPLLQSQTKSYKFLDPYTIEFVVNLQMQTPEIRIEFVDNLFNSMKN